MISSYCNICIHHLLHASFVHDNLTYIGICSCGSWKQWRYGVYGGIHIFKNMIFPIIAALNSE